MVGPTAPLPRPAPTAHPTTTTATTTTGTTHAPVSGAPVKTPTATLPPAGDGVDTPQPAPAPQAAPANTGLPRPGGMTAAQRATAISHSRLYQSLDPAVRQQVDVVLQRIQQSGSAVDMLSFQRILGSAFWAQASPAEQLEMAKLAQQIPLHDVDAQSSEQGRGVRSPMMALAEMSERSLNGRPMLLDRAHGGGTLVHHLSDMSERLGRLPANDPILRQTGMSASDIVGGAILEINDSGRIGQGNVGTCAATSIQLSLIERQPAEYIRLVTDLAVTGHATAANGATLDRVPSSIPPSPGNMRTVSERLFQSSVLDYANGDTRYEIGTKVSTREVPAVEAQPLWAMILEAIFFFPVLFILMAVKVTQETRETTEQNTGLYDAQIARGGSAVFGRPWRTHGGGASGAAELTAYRPDGRFEGETVQVSMRWCRSGEMHGYHALRLERIDPPATNPRMVYLHNPWGSEPGRERGSAIRPGQEPAGVVWAEPEKGIVAVPYDDFVNRLSGWTGDVQVGTELLEPGY